MRIIGTTEKPCFYAHEIAVTIGLTNVADAISEYDETEIVTDAVQRDLGIVTYNDNGVQCDNIILLTMWELFRLIASVRCELSTK